MSKLGYILRCVRNMNYKNMLNTVNTVHKKSGKNRVGLFCDMVWCGFKYGTGHRDYDLNEWWTLNKAQRSTYITRGINNSIVTRLNDSSYYHILDNKIHFNEHFSDCLGRKWLNVENASLEEFESFMENTEAVIAKPIDATCGQGVVKLQKSDFESVSAMYDHIRETRAFLVEEYVIQHSEISKLYPLSVNTLRIVTVTSDDGTPHVLYAFIRMGNNGRVVDNINAGGMAAPIDLETGKISGVAFDKDYSYYDTHPYTGTPIVGHQIPFWKESCEFALEACKRIPQLRYIGWDVAVTENGPTFIEGNQHPGHDFLQMPPHVPDKIGILPRFRQFVNI